MKKNEKKYCFAQDSNLGRVLDALNHSAICEVIILFSFMNFVLFFHQIDQLDIKCGTHSIISKVVFLLQPV